jgi:hypothetical protein
MSCGPLGACQWHDAMQFEPVEPVNPDGQGSGTDRGSASWPLVERVEEHTFAQLLLAGFKLAPVSIEQRNSCASNQPAAL